MGMDTGGGGVHPTGPVMRGWGPQQRGPFSRLGTAESGLALRVISRKHAKHMNRGFTHKRSILCGCSTHTQSERSAAHNGSFITFFFVLHCNRFGGIIITIIIILHGGETCSP